ncbi:Receptor-interacting serine/threonine-protein kinase 2 [Serendipita sp. 398]|nr:Receptor-interacting serine/threonine-protein kinase 2 [Serendipita sp. 398]
MDVWWKLEHPNIVPLLGYVDGFGPLHSPISPWYENGNASDYVKREGLGLEFRLQLLREVSSGLRYLHQQMPVIVHGDLKPGNVLIDNDGIARLCDFGLAHLVTSEGESMATGANVGTIRYSAPELRCPKDDDDKIMATTQTDIYSLACIAYEVILSNHS